MDSLNRALPRNAAEDVDRRQRLCPAGEVANSFLDRAPDAADRARRCRRLIAWGARYYFGVCLEDIASALGVTSQFVSKDTKGVQQSLRIEAARLGYSQEQAGLPAEEQREDTAA